MRVEEMTKEEHEVAVVTYATRYACKGGASWAAFLARMDRFLESYL